jgi:hypothetical protein
MSRLWNSTGGAFWTDMEPPENDDGIARNASASEAAKRVEQQQPERDARMYDVKEEPAEELIIGSSGDQVTPKGLLIDRMDFGKTPTKVGETENVLVVIISNRRDGIIPTIASILSKSTLPVDVVLIGVHEINKQVDAHFGKRIKNFVSLSVDDITEDLLAQDFQPIWTWPEWHTSIDNPTWRNENTIVRVRVFAYVRRAVCF